LDKPEIKITADGSHTLYLPDLDETYHSINGAIQEAIHIYINAGFNFLSKEELTILEVGFGTGLNTFLTFLKSRDNEIKVNYVSIEAYPLSIDLIKKLNYTKELGLTNFENDVFLQLHHCDWNNKLILTPNFLFTKLKMFLKNYEVKNQFDIIYFDAFGPDVQPEMWTLKILDKMYNALVKGCVLVTYCAKGSFKRTLKEVGFTIENIPGPPGKREMTRAIKN